MASAEDIKFCDILVVLSPRIPKARDAIQTIVEDLKRGSMINWSNFRTVLSKLYQINQPGFFYENCSAYFSNIPQTFEKFIFHILTVFDMHKCSDKSVIADVLELLYLAKCYSNGHRFRYHTWTGMQSNEINGQRPMSVFEKTLVFPYKDISSMLSPTLETKRMPCNWVAVFAIFGETDILKSIISQGATLIIPLKWNKILFISKLPQIIRLSSSAAILDDFEDVNTMVRDKLSRKRLYLVSMVVLIFFGNDFKSKTDLYTQCARIFINSTPEPLITYEEIESFLTVTCSGTFKNGEVLKLLKQYETSFPESRDASTPRTMQHLSRFQVRENLRTARSFPYGVESLGVPEKIKNLICLKDILCDEIL